MLMDTMLKKVEKFRDFIVNQHICDLIEVKEENLLKLAKNPVLTALAT